MARNLSLLDRATTSEKTLVETIPIDSHPTQYRVQAGEEPFWSSTQTRQSQTDTDIYRVNVRRSRPFHKCLDAILPGSQTIQSGESHPRAFIRKSLQFRLNRIQPGHKGRKATILQCRVVAF